MIYRIRFQAAARTIIPYQRQINSTNAQTLKLIKTEQTRTHLRTT